MPASSSDQSFVRFWPLLVSLHAEHDYVIISTVTYYRFCPHTP